MLHKVAQGSTYIARKHPPGGQVNQTQLETQKFYKLTDLIFVLKELSALLWCLWHDQ